MRKKRPASGILKPETADLFPFLCGWICRPSAERSVDFATYRINTPTARPHRHSAVSMDVLSRPPVQERGVDGRRTPPLIKRCRTSEQSAGGRADGGKVGPSGEWWNGRLCAGLSSAIPKHATLRRARKVEGSPCGCWGRPRCEQSPPSPVQSKTNGGNVGPCE